MTRKEMIERIEEYARECSKCVVFRTYVNGNSVDVEKKATKAQAAITYICIVGTLRAYLSGYQGDLKGVGEWVALFGFKQWETENKRINSYDTVYWPICDFLIKHQNDFTNFH